MGNLYRATDNIDIIKANVSDVINLNKITSWSLDFNMSNEKYKGTDYRLLVISNQTIKGIDISKISTFPDELEVLLAPCSLFVISITNYIINLKYINTVINDNI